MLLVNRPHGSQPYSPRRDAAVGANQKPDSSPIARERAQKSANEIPRSIVALDLEQSNQFLPGRPPRNTARCERLL